MKLDALIDLLRLHTATLIQERLVVLGCCFLAAVTKFQGKLARL